jgi:hypothetical protein
MKQTAVEYLIKEFSDILGKLQTDSMQDLLLLDAVNKAKEMEKNYYICIKCKSKLDEKDMQQMQNKESN